MKITRQLALSTLLLGSLALPAHADFCVQLDGGSYSGDIGFIRFKGSLPKGKGVMKPLNGRAAGLSPVYGSLVVDKNNGNYVEFAITLWVDNSEGRANFSLYGPDFTSGSGISYGDYSGFFDVTVVDCKLEP